jgi:predicted MFS family arabinose efflux permease
VALTGTLNGLGIVAITLVFGALPRQLVARGWDPVQAGQATHLAVAALCLLSALVALAGLKRGLPVRREDRPSLRELFTTGFSQARNPRVALAYACAFVARGDMVVLGTFTALWGTTAAVNRGVAAAEAVARGRMLIVIAQVAALAAAPLLGMMMDRINRVTGVAICMALAAIGYGSMVLVGDPLAPASWLWFALLGIGQIAAFFAAMTLLGQEAPAAGRGATTGMFNIAGALGILFCTGVGGRLFDGVGPRSPFLMLAGFNALLVMLALVVRRRSRVRLG